LVKTLPKPYLVSCGGKREERRGREEVEFSEIRGETNVPVDIYYI